jgi:uncharacterized membrane protein YecN with MAPEG domain
VGGLLLATASITGSRLVQLLGAVLFVVGVVVYCGVAVRRSRGEGIGLGASMGRSALDALRFAWYLMP